MSTITDTLTPAASAEAERRDDAAALVNDAEAVAALPLGTRLRDAGGVRWVTTVDGQGERTLTPEGASTTAAAWPLAVVMSWAPFELLPSTVGEIVREAAQRARVTLDDVAARAGIARRTFTRCLAGERDFTVTELARVGDVLGVEFGELLPPGMTEPRVGPAYGADLGVCRRACGASAETVAEAAGIDVAELDRFENGTVGLPTSKWRAALAAVAAHLNGENR